MNWYRDQHQTYVAAIITKISLLVSSNNCRQPFVEAFDFVNALKYHRIVHFHH